MEDPRGRKEEPGSNEARMLREDPGSEDGDLGSRAESRLGGVC